MDGKLWYTPTQWVLLSHEKGNPAIDSNMDESWEHYTKWSQSEKDKQCTILRKSSHHTRTQIGSYVRGWISSTLKCWSHYSVNIQQVIMLYTLNLHNATYQTDLKKSGKNQFKMIFTLPLSNPQTFLRHYGHWMHVY